MYYRYKFSSHMSHVEVQIICLNLRSKRTNLYNCIGLGIGLFSLKAD